MFFLPNISCVRFMRMSTYFMILLSVLVFFSLFCKHVRLSCVFLNKLTYLLYRVAPKNLDRCLPWARNVPNTSRGSVATCLRAQPLEGRGVRTPQNLGTDHPNFFDEESDYRYVTDCSPRNWVYYPYFVLYNNLDQGIGPLTLKTWLRPY